MDNYDPLAISGRIKNIIAREDLAISPAGTFLVNYFTLFLHELYEFADKNPGVYNQELVKILNRGEELPKNVIKVSTPKNDPEEELPLEDDRRYDYAVQGIIDGREMCRFGSNEEALKHFTEEYEALGAKYNKSGYEFWLEAECSSVDTDDYRTIMRLARSVAMCKHLMGKMADSE